MDDKAGNSSSQSQNEVAQVPSEVPNFDPSILNGLSPSTTSAWLEWETNRIMTYNALVQRYRNTLTPIHHFPNEILVRILKLVRDAMPPHSCPQPYKILYLSHVCSWWRQVIENDPFLWTQIHCEAKKEMVELFLNRSRTVNIDVFNRNLTGKDADRFIDLITRHAHRISGLTLCSPPQAVDAMHAVLSHLFLLNPINLQYLNVTMSPKRYPVPVVNVPMTASLVKLRSISLNFAILSLDMPVYSGLSRLHIRCAFAGIAPRPGFTTTQIIQTLSGCPNLEELALWRVLFSQGQALESPLQEISKAELPHLKILDLRDKLYELPFLLFHLILPQSTYISLEIHWPVNLGEEETRKYNGVIDMVQQVAPFHDLACLTQVTSLVMGYSDRDDTLKLTGRHCEKDVFDLRVHSSLFSVKGASGLAQILCTASIRSLVIQYLVLPEACTDDWLELFQILPGLSTLTLSCDTMYCFLLPERPKLVIDALGKATTRHAGVKCPGLEELEMRGIYYNKDLGSSLRQTLASRLANGAPMLKRLSLINICLIEEMSAFDFSKYCETVVLNRNVTCRGSSSSIDYCSSISTSDDIDDSDDGGEGRVDSEDHDESDDTEDSDNSGEDEA